MKKVTVPLENRSYDILIGENLISNFPIYLEKLLSRRIIAIVTDKNIENLHLSKLVDVLSEAGITIEPLRAGIGHYTRHRMRRGRGGHAGHLSRAGHGW